MRVIAHRGFAAEAPENTVAAVRRAGPRADAVEIDVRRCGSGELVVVHDSTVDRVTDGSGLVREHTLAELQDLDVLGSGEPIPQFEDVLAAVPDDVAIAVELKETGLADDVAAALRKVPNTSVVSSFSTAAIAEFRDTAPEHPTAYITDRLRDRPVDTALDLGCQFVHPSYPLCLFSRVVPRAKAAGLGVNAWTVNNAPLARLLAWRGVDGIASDRSDVVPS